MNSQNSKQKFNGHSSHKQRWPYFQQDMQSTIKVKFCAAFHFDYFVAGITINISSLSSNISGFCTQ
jgi:hypothetical protein